MCAALGAVAAALVTWRARSSSPSSTPAISPLARQYAALSDGTLRTCPPDRTPLAAFDTCLTRYRDGLDPLVLPPGVASTVQHAHEVIQLLQTWRSSPVHEDTTMRDWPPGCPQQGPSSVSDADAQDVTFRSQYFRILLEDDATLRSGVGAATAAATPGS